MHTEYRWLLAEAEADPAVRVVVVTGDPEGGAFCVGADAAALDGHIAKGGYDPDDSDETRLYAFALISSFEKRLKKQKTT